MNENVYNHTIVRTPRGLSIFGTRITLYQIMDYIKANQPTEIIRHHFRLTTQQMNDIMEYLNNHRDEVESEYQQILKQADENRRYWEEHNKDRFSKIAKLPRNPTYKELWAKLDAKKAELEDE